MVTRSAGCSATRDEPARRDAATPPGRRCDLSTRQELVVDARPDAVYAAIWRANLIASRGARLLSAVAMWPARLAARVTGRRVPRAARSATLGDMLAEESPWILVADEPGREVVLGLLWRPPAGAERCEPEHFAQFAQPGFAKVAWSLAVAADGERSRLITETRTLATDPHTRRRFRLMWPVIAPFAALLRRMVLRAVKREAERAVA